MGQRIVAVKTGAGVLRVTQRVNAENKLTGRIDGTTFEGSSWADVEEKIRRAYTDQRVWTKYLIVTAKDPNDDHEHYQDNTEAARAEIRYSTAEATQELVSDGRRGVWTRNDPRDRPWFQEGAKTAEDALGGRESAVLAWTPELEEEAERLRLAVRELASRLHAFVKRPDLERWLSGSALGVLALPEPVIEAVARETPAKGKGRKR